MVYPLANEESPDSAQSIHPSQNGAASNSLQWQFSRITILNCLATFLKYLYSAHLYEYKFM